MAQLLRVWLLESVRFEVKILICCLLTKSF